MEIQHRQSDGKGMFFISSGDTVQAEMTYSMASASLMIIDHTEVKDELRGRNAGYQLVQAAVLYARKNHIRIIPLCPFANSVFKKKPEFADVLNN